MRIKQKMAKFVGTLKEFTAFIDPRIRNNIANMTRPSKQLLGSKCQKCNEIKELDAAHKHGNSRPEIIERVLENYKIKDEIYEIEDVQKVVGEIRDAHLPMENIFIFYVKHVIVNMILGQKIWITIDQYNILLKTKDQKQISPQRILLI